MIPHPAPSLSKTAGHPPSVRSLSRNSTMHHDMEKRSRNRRVVSQPPTGVVYHRRAPTSSSRSAYDVLDRGHDPLVVMENYRRECNLQVREYTQKCNTVLLQRAEELATHEKMIRELQQQLRSSNERRNDLQTATDNMSQRLFQYETEFERLLDEHKALSAQNDVLRKQMTKGNVVTSASGHLEVTNMSLGRSEISAPPKRENSSTSFASFRRRALSRGIKEESDDGSPKPMPLISVTASAVGDKKFFRNQSFDASETAMEFGSEEETKFGRETSHSSIEIETGMHIVYRDLLCECIHVDDYGCTVRPVQSSFNPHAPHPPQLRGVQRSESNDMSIGTSTTAFSSEFAVPVSEFRNILFVSPSVPYLVQENCRLKNEQRNESEALIKLSDHLREVQRHNDRYVDELEAMRNTLAKCKDDLESERIAKQKLTVSVLKKSDVGGGSKSVGSDGKSMEWRARCLNEIVDFREDMGAHILRVSTANTYFEKLIGIMQTLSIDLNDLQGKCAEMERMPGDNVRLNIANQIIRHVERMFKHADFSRLEEIANWSSSSSRNAKFADVLARDFSKFCQTMWGLLDGDGHNATTRGDRTTEKKPPVTPPHISTDDVSLSRSSDRTQEVELIGPVGRPRQHTYSMSSGMTPVLHNMGSQSTFLSTSTLSRPVTHAHLHSYSLTGKSTSSDHYVEPHTFFAESMSTRHLDEDREDSLSFEQRERQDEYRTAKALSDVKAMGYRLELQQQQYLAAHAFDRSGRLDLRDTTSGSSGANMMPPPFNGMTNKSISREDIPRIDSPRDADLVDELPNLPASASSTPIEHSPTSRFQRVSLSTTTPTFSGVPYRVHVHGDAGVEEYDWNAAGVDMDTIHSQREMSDHHFSYSGTRHSVSNSTPSAGVEQRQVINVTIPHTDADRSGSHVPFSGKKKTHAIPRKNTDDFHADLTAFSKQGSSDLLDVVDQMDRNTPIAEDSFDM